MDGWELGQGMDRWERGPGWVDGVRTGDGWGRAHGVDRWEPEQVVDG